MPNLDLTKPIQTRDGRAVYGETYQLTRGGIFDVFIDPEDLRPAMMWGGPDESWKQRIVLPPHLERVDDVVRFKAHKTLAGLDLIRRMIGTAELAQMHGIPRSALR